MNNRSVILLSFRSSSSLLNSHGNIPAKLFILRTGLDFRQYCKSLQVKRLSFAAETTSIFGVLLDLARQPIQITEYGFLLNGDLLAFQLLH